MDIRPAALSITAKKFLGHLFAVAAQQWGTNLLGTTI